MKILDLDITRACLNKISDAEIESFDATIWQSIIPDKVRSPMLYRQDQIRRETESLIYDYQRQVKDKGLELGRDHEALFEDDIFWFGRAKDGVFPGYVNGDRMLIIGDAGVDMPIGLYYLQGTGEEPMVVYFNNDLLWVQIANSLDDFLSKIKLFDED
jgi:hypothetical protein